MTSQLSDLHPQKDFLSPKPASFSRSWLILAALGLFTGAGLAVWTLSEAGATPSSPPAGEALSALVAEQSDESANSDESDPSDGFEPDEPAAPERVAPATAKPAAAPTDESEAADEVAGGFYVQVASYKDEDDAAGAVKALSNRGLRAESVTSPGSSWNKVRLGPFESRVEAEAARFELGVNERQKAYVLPRSNGKYHVQVGSFETREQAEPVANRLIARGHVTKISRIKMGDQRWHCVRIGPFDTHEEAEGYRKLVGEVPGSKTRVIPFETEGAAQD